jgi:hypothetical protein
MLTALVPLVLAALLAWSGAGKLATRSPGADTALADRLDSPGRADLVLRAVAVVELALAAGLLAPPFQVAAGAGVAVLGAGFLGYLAWARAVAPGASCGCTGRRHAPITWRSFARAGLVLAGGMAAWSAGPGQPWAGQPWAGQPWAGQPWWSVLAERPVAAGTAVVVAAAGLAALSADLDHRWLLPLRQARIRLLGHPLSGPPSGTAGTVPLAATVELLERSLAWESAAPVVRSGLVEHWDADGWRVLRYTGVQDDRPVSVLFALDAGASSATTANPAIRVTVLPEAALAPA